MSEKSSLRGLFVGVSRHYFQRKKPSTVRQLGNVVVAGMNTVNVRNYLFLVVLFPLFSFARDLVYDPWIPYTINRCQQLGLWVQLSKIPCPSNKEVSRYLTTEESVPYFRLSPIRKRILGCAGMGIQVPKGGCEMSALCRSRIKSTGSMQSVEASIQSWVLQDRYVTCSLNVSTHVSSTLLPIVVKYVGSLKNPTAHKNNHWER